MTPSSPNNELLGLLYDLSEDRLSTRGAERLEEMLAADPANQQRYVDFMLLVSGLHQTKGAASGQWPVVSGQWSDSDNHPSSFILQPSSIPPIIVDPTPVHHTPFGSFVFSHIAAAVILGIGLLIGLAWRISLPSPEGPSTRPTDVVKVVGRITALADCKWSRQGSGYRGLGSGIPKTKDQRPKTVFLGDRLLVSSGLMEITYNTGAKVILEGPCTYQVESDRSGFLAIGRLTARVEKGSGIRDQGSGAIHPSAFSLQPSALFAVRTPTATVTDLGTEFGVEVEKSGATRSHVFQGKVELVASGQRPVASDKKAIHLTAGESARVERGRNNKVAITREPGQPNRFVRQISKTTNGQTSKSSSLILHPSSFAYRLTDLGTLGGTTSHAYAMNAAGHVVGEAATADGTMHAFLYADGKMQDLGTLHGGSSWAFDINIHGQIVGGSGIGKPDSLPFVYGNGSMESLGTLGGPTACAHAINDAGTVVGLAQNQHGVMRAFLKSDGRAMKDLGAFGGPTAGSRARGINDTGLVVGCAETQSGAFHAFVYDNAEGMKDLGTLGGKDSLAFRVNNAGLVVGDAQTADGLHHAFLWDGKGMKRLERIDGLGSVAFDVNDAGLVVGSRHLGGHAANRRAFLHDGGTTIDLDMLVNRPGWTLQAATAVNDSGWIAGYGRAPDGSVRAFLLTPENGTAEDRSKE